MQALTCGERITRCLCGEPIDRVPFGVRAPLGWQPWGETWQQWLKESGNPNLDLSQELGYARPEVEAGIFPKFEKKILEESVEVQNEFPLEI